MSSTDLRSESLQSDQHCPNTAGVLSSEGYKEMRPHIGKLFAHDRGHERHTVNPFYLTTSTDRPFPYINHFIWVPNDPL